METHELRAHRTANPEAPSKVTARLTGLDKRWLTMRWRLDNPGPIAVPAFAGNARTDGLWQTTCFEFFVRSDDGDAYSEFNFSPSEQWAAYDFTAYREGMRERVVPRAPVCTWRPGSTFAIFDVALPTAALPALPASIALTAVIEQQDGAKSYWATAHPPGQPDFHDPACFTIRLEAPLAS